MPARSTRRGPFRGAGTGRQAGLAPTCHCRGPAQRHGTDDLLRTEVGPLVGPPGSCPNSRTGQSLHEGNGPGLREAVQTRPRGRPQRRGRPARTSADASGGAEPRLLAEDRAGPASSATRAEWGFQTGSLWGDASGTPHVQMGDGETLGTRESGRAARAAAVTTRGAEHGAAGWTHSTSLRQAPALRPPAPTRLPLHTAPAETGFKRGGRQSRQGAGQARPAAVRPSKMPPPPPASGNAEGRPPPLTTPGSAMPRLITNGYSEPGCDRRMIDLLDLFKVHIYPKPLGTWNKIETPHKI